MFALRHFETDAYYGQVILANISGQGGGGGGGEELGLPVPSLNLNHFLSDLFFNL